MFHVCSMYALCMMRFGAFVSLVGVAGEPSFIGKVGLELVDGFGSFRRSILFHAHCRSGALVGCSLTAGIVVGSRSTLLRYQGAQRLLVLTRRR